MNTTLDSEAATFREGPFPHFQKSLGLFRPLGLRTSRRATLVVIIGWVPLIVLVAIQGIRVQESVLKSFLFDAGVHARSLIAAPLFILVETLTLSRLTDIVRHFVHAGLVIDEERPRFHLHILIALPD